MFITKNILKLVLCALFCSLAATAAWADGAVYAMTNALGNNQILVYHRAADGNLSLVQTVSTGGGGSGLQLAGVDSLGSAGSLQVDEGHHFVFAVNTESAAENNGAGTYNTDCQQGTITSFAVASDGSLTFADRVFSGGLFPNSLTVKTILVLPQDGDDHGKGKDKGDKDDVPVPETFLYALNAGGPEPPAVCHVTPATANTPNITGFRVDNAGNLIPLGVTQPIDSGPASAPSGVSCTAAGASGFSALTGAPTADFQCGLNPPSFPRSPAQVQFAPNGGALVVTVKGTNTIYVFAVDANGIATSTPTVMQVPGPALPTFLGFTFDKVGDLLVTELFGTSTTIPAGGKGAVSSFAFTGTGNLIPISSDVDDGGTAASFIALEPLTGRFAYVSNNLSASISSYAVGTNGILTLLNGTAAASSGPNDLATAAEGSNSWLYVVDAGTGTVGALHINGDGSLSAITGGSGLPAGRSAQGIAAF